MIRKNRELHKYNNFHQSTKNTNTIKNNNNNLPIKTHIKKTPPEKTPITSSKIKESFFMKKNKDQKKSS